MTHKKSSIDEIETDLSSHLDTAANICSELLTRLRAKERELSVLQKENEELEERLEAITNAVNGVMGKVSKPPIKPSESLPVKSNKSIKSVKPIKNK